MLKQELLSHASYRAQTGHDNESHIARTGTGLVQLGDRPPSLEDEEEEDKYATIKDYGGENEGYAKRSGTGFVQPGDWPPPTDEAEVDKYSVLTDSHGVLAHTPD